MSREYNYGGTSLIVDSIEELFENGAVQTKTVSNIKQVIGLQRQSKDINKLKEQIESATDDGVITASEKPGLKREWASLESSYATISDKFTQDDTLKDNSLFYVLKARFNELSPIMDEIFADMNSSYKNAEKVSKLTDLFVESWKYITLCSQLLETKLSISDRFSLQISPTREIVGPLDIRVTLLYLTNGIYSDVTNLSTYLDSDFVWKKTSDENFERTGRVLSLTLDDMSSNEEQFTLTFKHTFTYEDPNATDVVIAKSISFAVSTGTLSQWTWSDAATKEELLMDPLAIWLDYRREFNTKKYLWRRDTNDLLKADSEKEWLYFRESGLDGLIGSNGYSRAVLELFKRSETTPASFDGGVITYTFSTNAISGDTGTWQKTIPEGEHPLYIIKATAFANTETDSISTGEWTTPAILSEHGTDGATGATAFSLVLYQRSEYSPSKPSDIVTYNIKTGAISGNGNWSLSFPSNNGYPCWAINATAFSYTDTDEITPSEWSDVQKLVENGKNGTDAKLIKIVADSNIIRFDSSNIPYEGTKASLSLQTSGMSSNTATWTVDGIDRGPSETLDIYPEDFDRDWITSTASSTARMRCIAHADNIVMMGGVSGALVYSTDGGDSWTTVPAFTSGAITGLCYNKGRYVAVDSNGKIFSSDNIASGWPSQDNPTYSTGKILNAITTDGSVFVAVGETYPGTTGIICTSTDGLEWQTISTDCPNLYAICYDSKKFHAIGAGGIVWASEDGTRWTQTANIGFDCRGISYDGKYIAGGQGGNIAYSNDGKNWYMGTVKRTSTATVSHIRAIASEYGVYYSVCYLSNGYGEIWKSHNGRDWEVCFEPNAANTRLWAVSFASGYMIASGDNGNVYRLPLPRSLLVKAESEGYSDTISIIALQDAIGTSGADGVDGVNGSDGVGIESIFIDYQISSSGTEEPTGDWEDTYPNVPKGNYLWTRTTITYTDGNSKQSLSVTYMPNDGPQGPQGPKGEDGKDGEDGADGKDAIPPKYQWRLGSSSTEPPVDTINHLADGAVSTFDGTVLAETNTGWLDVRPTPTAELPYIWERMSSDGGLTWSDPYCLSINTIKNIEIVADPASFDLNSRGVSETLQTITCTIVRNNAIDPCFWTVTKDGNLTDIVATEGDSITFSVAVGETTKNIEVSAVCSGMARAVNIFSKIVGKIVPANLTHELTGHYNDTVYIPEVFSDGITPVMKGDYIIYYPIDDSTGKEYPTPAVYNGSAWVPVKAETAPDNYSQIMSDTLPDVLASGITVPVVSAYYGYFENLAAQAAVITKLFSEFIKIGGAIYGGAYDQNGNNTTGGAGFYLGNDGLFRAIDATLDKVMIKGELISSYLSTIVPADRIYTINMTTPTTYVYHWETVKRSFVKFMYANMEVKEGNVCQATGYYSGIEYTSIEFSKGGSYARATVENKVFKWPIINTRIGVPYVDFNKIWSMTYNGNTFTSDDPQFKEVEFTDVQAQELSIIEQNKQYKAIGTVEGGGKKIVATEDHPMYIKRYAAERYSFTQDGTEIYFYVSGYTKAPASVNISFYENLEGVSVHNLFRNSAESSIGHSLKPFKEAHITSVNSKNIYRGDENSNIGTEAAPFSKVYATELHGKVYYS